MSLVDKHFSIEIAFSFQPYTFQSQLLFLLKQRVNATKHLLCDILCSHVFLIAVLLDRLELLLLSSLKAMRGTTQGALVLDRRVHLLDSRCLVILLDKACLFGKQDHRLFQLLLCEVLELIEPLVNLGGECLDLVFNILFVDFLTSDDPRQEQVRDAVWRNSFPSEDRILHKGNPVDLLFVAVLDGRTTLVVVSLRDDGNQEVEQQDDIEDGTE